MTIEKLLVRYYQDEQTIFDIGTLAIQGHRLFFEYSQEFLQKVHWLSPFRLPPKNGLVLFEDWRFGDIWGLFDDSLPDGWGLLLMDRFFRSQNISLQDISILDRLAYLGSNTMGALTYHPCSQISASAHKRFDLFQLSQEAQTILEGTSTEILSDLLFLGGSPGGARPKILVGVQEDHLIAGVDSLPPGYAHWLLKFHSHQEEREEGIIEHCYALLANKAGLDMPATRLFFEPNQEKYFFAIQRFDRTNLDTAHNQRCHIHSFGGLIHSNHRRFECDYDTLLQVTRVLTKKQDCVEKVFRQMIFNIVLNNRDDHVKNFAFRYDLQEWSYAPSYDLTFCYGPRGEHSMSIHGEGKTPTKDHVLRLAKKHNIPSTRAKDILAEVIEASTHWKHVASDFGISQRKQTEIWQCLEGNINRVTQNR